MRKISLRSLGYSGAENFAVNEAETSKPGFFSSPAFSEDGFIERQQKLGALPCAARDSAYCGCGWIAVWNLFKSEGTVLSIPKLISEFEHGAVLRGVLGTSPFFLRKYLKRAGKKVFSTISVKKLVRKAPERGIAFYWRKDLTGHFAAFSRCENGLYRFYNHGKSPDIIPMEAFGKNKKHIFTLFFCVEDGG
ncbi:MAG: hypothetical protein ACI4IW_06905 [Oscillospiraceae bacterium]